MRGWGLEVQKQACECREVVTWVGAHSSDMINAWTLPHTLGPSSQLPFLSTGSLRSTKL